MLLLDTCILIDLLRKERHAINFVSALDEQPHACPVTSMELLAGARSQREETEIDELLGTFLMVSLGPDCFRRAGSWLRHFQASHSLDVPHALIAATAETHGLKLATLNTKHFPMFPKLKRAY